MRHSRSLITLIETAEASTPFCSCGSHMVPADHDGDLWLECVEHDVAPRTLVDRIRAFMGHDRTLLLSREELAA